MPGRNTGSNKFAYSPYIVGPILGDGCNYDVIQDAINDAFAAGGGEVLVKPGIYTENLVLQSGVDLIGAEVDGRLPPSLSQVNVDGNMTLTAAGGFSVVICKDMNFSCTTGDLLTITGTAGASIIFALKFSGMDATTDPTSRACVLNADGTSSCQFSTDNTQIQSASHCFDNIGVGSGSAFLSLGTISSSSGSTFQVSSGSGNISCEYTQVSGSYIMNGSGGVGSATFSHSDIFASNEVVLFSGAGGNCNAQHSTISSGAPSGFWIDGPLGTLNFGDILFIASVQDAGPTITLFKINWQPYGETAGGSVGSNRGTASFDSASFSVTDGWVQAAGNIGTQFGTDSGTAIPVAGLINIFGGPGVTTSASVNDIFINSVVWDDQPAPTTVTSDSGSFDTGPTTLTLPAAPLQGEECRFFSINSPTVIQANAGQIIQIGNTISSLGGTATGTDTGDSLVLVFYAAGSRWCSMATNGNWVLA